MNEEQPHSGLRKSFPGGRVDPDDSGILLSAQREMKEETGYSFNKWKLVKVWQPHTKIEWFIHLLLAWDVASVEESNLDPGEKIELLQMPFAEVKDLVITKSGYLGESIAIFENVNSVEELLALPEFQGKEVSR